ncbi:hypothetical protein [Amycolatopsis nigrescens]|uniref:hypothetical protein n=1 Tax=Amycolatopsis nigrescens TaxID=381445 RepID=UPI00037B82F2|nr:hypothetical protein [Amycolatopsis nigrescens]
MPEYDLESMELVEGKIRAIHDKFQESKAKVTGVTGQNPFGKIRHPDDNTDPNNPGTEMAPSPSDDAAKAVQGFTEGAQGELEAGAQLMTDTSDSLRAAIKMIREQEAAAKDSVTIKGEPA